MEQATADRDVRGEDGGFPETTVVRGRDIVCVGFADWDSQLWTNQHHLMSRLARYNRVLFVESLGLRRPQFAVPDVIRMARRLRQGLAPPRPVGDLHVFSPLVVPLHGSTVVRTLNYRLLPRLVVRAVDRLGIQEPLLWSYVPQAECLVEALRPSTIVYHCVDDLAAQKGIDAESFRAAEHRFARRADLVLASSAPLARRMRQLSRNVVEVPNVADTRLFASALEPGPVEPAIVALPAPRIVFTGAVVATKLDVGLLVQLARLRPSWSFVLVGPIGTGDPGTNVSPLAAEPNIHLLGSRDYEALPAVLRGADAALIPYALNELTRSIFPMKVYEYLAAGLPVIATPLPSLEDVEGIVVAADGPSMAQRLDEMLADDGQEQRARRSELARGHSWEARVAEIAEAVARLERSGTCRVVAGRERL